MASLRSKVEGALTGALAGLGATVYAGTGSDDKVLPCIIARAASAREDFANSGNYIVTCEITVKDTAASTSTFDTICDSVRAVIKTDVFAAALSGTDFTVFGVAAEDRVEWGTDGDSWTETRTIEIACCEQDFA